MMTSHGKPGLALVVFLLLAAALLSACGFRAAPSSPVVATSVPAPTAAPQTETEATATPSIEISFAVEEPEDGSDLQATLIPQSGQVEVRRSDRSTYERLLQNQAVLVTSGDLIRTGSNAQAKIIFEDDTETILFENTVLVVSAFKRGDDGSHHIQMMQYIGSTFNRVNFAVPNSTVEHMTPYGVASVRGTSYWVDVTISGPFASRLLSQQLETFVAELGASILADDFDALLQAVLNLLGGTPGTVSVDVAAGTVSFTDNAGNVVTVQTGFTANSGTDASGDTIRVTTTIIDRFCGDGLCDAYLGESAATCAADC